MMTAMPLPLITNTIRCAIEGHMPNGRPWVNVLHINKQAGESYATGITAINAALVNHLTVAAGSGIPWKTCATSLASVDNIRYTPLDGTTNTTVIAAGITGVATGEDLPGDVALVITLRTGTRGRSYRGRVYQAPFNEGNNGPTQKPTAGIVTGVNTQWTALITTLATATRPLVVASYKLAIATPVLQATIDPLWDNQRRRNHP